MLVNPNEKNQRNGFSGNGPELLICSRPKVSLKDWVRYHIAHHQINWVPQKEKVEIESLIGGVKVLIDPPLLGDG